MDLDSSFPQAAAPAPGPAAPAETTGPARTGAGHPLLWAAVVVWLSIEAIGDGVLALGSLLASLSARGSLTPTPADTPNGTDSETPTPTPSW
jgi:hypothetical protein